ncbi:ABC transporter substrate-binding protein [Streptomyces sp. 8N616]|uniref:ABC transporter substrate-binding protein n=1 Tax=Streptomyces sp. 8N616 TaxID=3457414 RepID=UPI003FD3CD23
MARPVPRLIPLLIALLTLGAGALTSAGCSAGSGGASASGARDRLAIGFAAEPANLDFTRTDGAAIPEALLVNVYEGLVKVDQKGAVRPLLARSWTVSPDRKTYDFTLQKGVVFSNGKRFTADDVKFSIERVKSSAWTVSLKKAMDVVESVQVVSPTEVKVVLARPSNDWLFQMTTRVGAMFSRNGVSDLANKPIGTGPYVLDAWRRGDSIALRANPRYWGAKPSLKTVTLKYFKDPTALNNALQTGGIDVISAVQTPDALQQFDTDRFQVVEGTTNGEVLLSLNSSRPPLNDKRVRQAINHAVDRKALLDVAWAGRGRLIGSMVPPHDPWYEDLSRMYPYDPDKARRLLAEAGKPRLDLRFRIPNLPYALSAAQVVKSQLARVGIAADIEPLEFPARWLDLVFTRADYDMSLINHIEPRDIVTFGDPDFYWRYDNPRVRRQLADAVRADEKGYVQGMRKVARSIAEDAAAAWLYLAPNLIVAGQDVKGLPRNRVSESFDLTALRVSS